MTSSAQSDQGDLLDCGAMKRRCAFVVIADVGWGLWHSWMEILLSVGSLLMAAWDKRMGAGVVNVYLMIEVGEWGGTCMQSYVIAWQFLEVYIPNQKLHQSIPPKGWNGGIDPANWLGNQYQRSIHFCSCALCARRLWERGWNNGILLLIRYPPSVKLCQALPSVENFKWILARDRAGLPSKKLWVVSGVPSVPPN